MIDLNSTMAAPQATQSSLIVMDAQMSPITFSRVGENFVPSLEESGNINIKHQFIASSAFFLL